MALTGDKQKEALGLDTACPTISLIETSDRAGQELRLPKCRGTWGVSGGSRLVGMSRRRPLDPGALRAARLQIGLTQHELAREVGVAGGERVSLWELGKTSPHPRVTQRLAAALKMGVEDLLLPGIGEPDLRELRTAAGLSLRSLSALAHVSKTTLVRWELEGVTELPTRATLNSYASALGVSVEAVKDAMSRSRG